MRFISRSLIVAFLVITASTSLVSGDKATTIYIVRHAEKEGTSGDVPLSAAGVKRAECLASMLSDAGIEAVFTTEFRRTRTTAEPLAKKLNITADTVPGAETAKLVDALKKLDGKNALVVGHSNTVPKIVDSLSGGALPAKAMADDEYDRLYVVTLLGNQASVAVLRYCKQ